MARLRYNGLSTALGGSGLASGATTSVTFAAALTYNGGTAVPTITGTDYIPLSILDSTGKLAEIVWLTAYTTGGTTGTITRGQEGTTGAARASGLKVTQSPTTSDAPATVFKSADESVASSTTLQDDDHLIFTAEANSKYFVVYYLRASSASDNPDIQFNVTVPSGATAWQGILGQTTAATAAASDVKSQAGAVGTALSGAISSAAGSTMIMFFAFVTTGATAGAVTLQWAQFLSSASASTLLAGSTLVAHKLA